MAVEQFTKAEFEDALPKHRDSGRPLWIHTGLVQGEHEYCVHVTDGDTSTNKLIRIRSSIGENGVSANSGKDSIRLWIEYEYKDRYHPLKKHKTRWTTRVPGKPVDGSDGKLTEQAKAVLQGLKLEQPAQSQPKRKFPPTDEQSTIFDWIANGTGNAMVRAGPGTGKSTTSEWGTEYIPNDCEDVAYLAFNVNIVQEMKARMSNSRVLVSTFHSLGLSNIRQHWGKIKVVSGKVYWIVKDLIKATSREQQEKLWPNAKTIQDLVGYCKCYLLDPTEDNLNFISTRHKVELNGSQALIFEYVAKALAENDRQTWRCDFGDMIRWCAIGLVSCQKFDFLMVDEAQDTNVAQRQFILNSLKPNGRVLAVGDKLQAIYGFRAASPEAMDELQEVLQAQTFPLMTSWRLPKSHVQMLQHISPELKAAPSAIEGMIGNLSESRMLAQVQPGHVVLCRCNAPLVRPCFSLNLKGIKAIILGKDIGKNLVGLVKKVQKQRKVNGLGATLKALDEYVEAESAKLEEAGRGMTAQTLEDKAETIHALSDGCTTVAELEQRIEQVFSDDIEGVTFSSIHKFKGAEAEVVYLLKPSLLPHPKAVADWELEQELHLEFVAGSRSKKELYFVE